MRTYDKYKDSGISWIGKVPEDWSVRRIKYIGYSENGLTYSPNDITKNAGVLVLRSSNIQNNRLAFDDNVYVKAAPKKLMLHKGDIIICSRNGSVSLIGKSALIEEDMNATFGAFMLRFHSKYNSKYIYYLVSDAISKYKGLFATTTINQLTKSAFASMHCAFAPNEEQEAIANYLDKKTAEIDKIIAEREKKIELLNELKSSIISRAVTKGINPHAKMKDSGIDWIGEIPEEWKVVPLKFVAFLNPKVNIIGDYDLVSYAPMINVRNDNLRDEEINPKKLTSGLNSFAKGDILMAKVTPCFENGNIAIANKIRHDIGFCSSELFVIRAYNINRRYLFYTLQNNEYKHACIATMTGSGGLKRISGIFVSDCKMPYPSLSEQERISKYLDRKINEVDKAIATIRKECILYKEYKQSLISEVVTGKRKVID